MHWLRSSFPRFSLISEYAELHAADRQVWPTNTVMKTDIATLSESYATNILCTHIHIMTSLSRMLLASNCVAQCLLSNSSFPEDKVP